MHCKVEHFGLLSHDLVQLDWVSIVARSKGPVIFGHSERMKEVLPLDIPAQALLGT